MITRAFLKALDQLADPAFRKVFFMGAGITTALFAAMIAGVWSLTPENVQYFDWDWVNDAFGWILGFAIVPGFVVMLWFLFPALATLFMGLFLDDIIDAVEAKHYPGSKATRRISIRETLLIALRMSATIILINLLALPVYIILLFTAVGPLILFLVLNSYLLGREYFELVAVRHFLPQDARKIRRAHRDSVFLAGGLITLMFMVPFLNLLAPIIGAAMMVHVFHASISSGDRA